MSANLAALIPEALILIAALCALFSERLPGGDKAAPRLGAALAALAAVVAGAIGVREPIADGALAFDGVAVIARVGVAALTALYLLWLSGSREERVRETASFALFAALGGMLMASARDLVTLFIAIELGTMPAYVMIGRERGDARTLEGALKYYLLSMTTSLVMLYGFSFLFGLSGSTQFTEIGTAAGSGLLGTFAVLFAFAGVFAKLSAAPFHFWTPDAYAGAPAASVAFVSTVPKIAGAAVLVTLASALGASGALPMLLGAGALVSMLLGNLGAYPQRDVRRLMAYSGIAHSGYILLAASVGGHSAVLYAIAYTVPSMAVMLIAAEEGCAIDDLAGLVQRQPLAAWALALFLLSLVGIPPMAGFFGKLYAFTAALAAGRVTLVVIAVLMSVVSAGYYFKLIRPAFFDAGVQREGEALPAAGRTTGLVLAIAAAFTLLFAFGLDALSSVPGIRF